MALLMRQLTTEAFMGIDRGEILEQPQVNQSPEDRPTDQEGSHVYLYSINAYVVRSHRTPPPGPEFASARSFHIIAYSVYRRLFRVRLDGTKSRFKLRDTFWVRIV